MERSGIERGDKIKFVELIDCATKAEFAELSDFLAFYIFDTYIFQLAGARGIGKPGK